MESEVVRDCIHPAHKNGNEPTMKSTSKLEALLRVVLILLFIVAMYLQHNVGLADNGDFSHLMSWISSGPVGMENNWPTFGTKDWSKRFFDYWIPYWNLDWSRSRPTTSAILLWLPGALLNTALYSSKVLYLPTLSLFPKLILFGWLLLLFKWIELETRHKVVFLFSLGLPAILLLTTTDYVAYFNSFFQESASFVFLFLLIASIVLLRRRPTYLHLSFSLVSTLLLATSKPANLYWPLLTIPIISYVWSTKRNFRLIPTVITSLILIILFTFASAIVTEVGSIEANPYHSFFYGVLTFSDNPGAHLQDLGMGDATPCVNTSAYSSTGLACIEKYQNQLSFQDTIRVVYREPAVLFRIMKYAFDNMQDISLDYLGKYSYDAPPKNRTLPFSYLLSSSEKRYWVSTVSTSLLNLWSGLKFRFFPTGYTLFSVLIIFMIWFVFIFKRTGIYQDFALIGLMCTIACVTDITVTVLGDGKYELIRHLFLSNMLFDIAAIVFLNSILVFCLEVVGKNRGQHR